MSALRDENLSWGQEVTPRQTRQFSTFLLPLLYRCLLGCVEQAVRPLPSPTVREAAERTGSSHRCLPRPIKSLFPWEIRQQTRHSCEFAFQ
jgi:hypothetical protein